MKRLFLIPVLILAGACAEEKEIGPVYDTAGVERRTLRDLEGAVTQRVE